LRSLRPTSLGKLSRILSVIGSSEGLGFEELTAALDISYGHVRELIRMLQGLGLVDVVDGKLKLSGDGFRFLEAISLGDRGFIHSLLSRSTAYKLALECYKSGLEKVSDIARCAGVSIASADIAVRLIREVESLKPRTSSSPDTGMMEVFEKAIRDTYLKLVSSRRSRYVSLLELLKLVSSNLGVSVEECARLLGELARMRAGNIVLTTSPALANREYVEISGRRYTHVMIVPW
jgi:predicted transcriptional regulator